MMKVAIPLFFASVFAAPLSAQYLYQENIQHMGAGPLVAKKAPTVVFNNKKAVIEGDQLLLSFDFVGNGKFIGRNEALILRPIYKMGKEQIKLPFALINGTIREKYYKREMKFLSHEEYLRNKPFIHTIRKGKGEKVVNYQIAYVLPKGTPKNGELVVEQYLQNCCDLVLVMEEPFTLGYSAVRPLPIPTPPPAPAPAQPRALTPPAQAPRLWIDLASVTFLKPEKEVRKERNQSLSLRINFKLNRHDILPHYSHNYEELRRVDSLLAPFAQQKEFYTLNRASIRGYASPEDSYEHNMRLSQKRADSFKNYLMTNYHLHTLANFPAIGMGEDWKGLREAIEKSFMPSKQQVLRIIDEVDLFRGREKMLMDLDGGMTYRYMLKNLYPPLRRMEMEVSYMVNAFDLGQSKNIIKTRPQDLSHEEIYSIAQENNQSIIQRDVFGEEYILAARIFPKDLLANVNAASAWLIRGEFDKAWEHLEPIKDDYRAYNNVALYYWGKNNYELAETYFVKAMQMGVDQKQALSNYQKFKQSTR